MNPPRLTSQAPALARGALALLALGLCALALDRPAPVGADTRSGTTISRQGDGYAYGAMDDDDSDRPAGRFEWALVEEGGSDASLSISDSHDMSDVQRAQRRAKRLGRSVLWVRLDGRSYLVTDPDLVARAARLIEPMKRLGKEQGRLGEEQGRLGAEQGRMGAIEGRLGALQARVAVARATTALGGRDRDDDGSDVNEADLDALQREIDELRVQTRELAAAQGALGARQGELGRRQGELGRRQAAASRRAAADLRALAHEALRAGRAEGFEE